MVKVIQTLKNYNSSQDYNWLANEMKEKSIICIVDYKFNVEDKDEQIKFRDVGQTVYMEKNGEGIYYISCRGHSYISAFNEAEFIKACEFNNVEFIRPFI